VGYLFGGPGFFEVVLTLLFSVVAAALAFVALKKSKPRLKLGPKFFILCTIPPLVPHCYYFMAHFLWSSPEGILIFLVLGAAIWVASYLFMNGLYRFFLSFPKRRQNRVFAFIIAALLLAIPVHVLLGKHAYTPCCKPQVPGGNNCVVCAATP